MITAAMKTTAIAPWFGANRIAAKRVGEELGKLAWCGIPFCGGCPELPHIRTRGGICADLHRHIINLANVIRDEDTWVELVDRLDTTLFHPDELDAAQRRCVEREQEANGGGLFSSADFLGPTDRVPWAADYFVACWMGRGGHAGKDTEFTQGLAVRWTASGGDSAVRFRSAIESLHAWHLALKKWQFERSDCFDFLDRVKDEAGHGLYVDAPWPDEGIEYKHKFDDDQQTKLAERLSRFKKTRVVVRYGDHSLIRFLYPESRWRWEFATTRNQKNNDVREALIVNGGPL